MIAVRLVDGPSAREGRLEVYYNSSWGTVCDDGFTKETARVVCYILGYGYVIDAQNINSACIIAIGRLFYLTMYVHFFAQLVKTIVAAVTKLDARDKQCCDLETMVSGLECTRVHFVQVSVSVSRPEVQGLGLGLKT